MASEAMSGAYESLPTMTEPLEDEKLFEEDGKGDVGWKLFYFSSNTSAAHNQIRNLFCFIFTFYFSYLEARSLVFTHPPLSSLPFNGYLFYLSKCLFAS